MLKPRFISQHVYFFVFDTVSCCVCYIFKSHFSYLCNFECTLLKSHRECNEKCKISMWLFQIFVKTCLDCVCVSFPQSLGPNLISQPSAAILLPRNTIYKLCSFYAMHQSHWYLATICCHLTRTVKDFPIRTFVSRIERLL